MGSHAGPSGRSMQMSRKKLIVVPAAIALAVALLAAGCGNTAKVGKFKIGGILSLSGPSAPLGQSEQRSINLLKQQLGKGGINGTPVDFIIIDDESDPAKATTAANRLITQEKVCAIIGCSSTGSTLAIMPAVEKAMIPVVAMAAGTKVTQPPKEWVFSVAPGDALVVQRALMYFKDEIKVQRIAILHDSNAYGTGGADEVMAQAVVDLIGEPACALQQIGQMLAADDLIEAHITDLSLNRDRSDVRIGEHFIQPHLVMRTHDEVIRRIADQ